MTTAPLTRIAPLAIFTSAILLAACGQEPPAQNAAAQAPVIEPAAPVSCANLATTVFPGTTITSAEEVAAGAFTPPAGGFPGLAANFAGLPAFCRVIGSIQPTGDSDIRFELWLPAENWNGRFMQTGNGGAAGSIVHSSFIEPLMKGYAVANTDTGHTDGGSDIWGWAVGHPEKLTDYAWRAVHELTVLGKAVTTTRYGSTPEKSYFVGCSTGGRQGLMEAQRFPDDYDAIVAGAPANNWSPLMALSIVIQANLGDGGLGLDQLGLLKASAIAACDALDGVEDNVITDIKGCGFDPASLQCQAGQTGQCLSAQEVSAAQRVYAGVTDATGRIWIPGTGPASEPLWGAYTSPNFSIGSGFFRDVVLQQPDWDPATWDTDVHMPPAQEVGRQLIAMDPDLSGFFAGGGKLITYHGTTDGLIPYGNSVNYFDSMLATLGEEAVDASARFYLVPGMDHCAGGDGAHVIDWLGAMEAWEEQGQVPGTLVGMHPTPPPGFPGSDNATPFTRPICAYPQVPVYDGNGDVNSAASFSCVAP